MGKLHRVRIIRRKTGNIPGERYAWIKFTINDKEKQEMRLFVYRILRIMIIPGLSEPPVRTLGATFPEIESHVYR